MSLDWNITACADIDALHEEDNQWHITQCIIWATLVTNVGQLRNEKDCKNFYTRYLLSCRIYNENPQFNYADLVRRIGFQSNVQTRSLPYFRRRIYDGLLAEANRRLKEELT